MGVAEKQVAPFSLSGSKFYEVPSILHRPSVAFRLFLWYTVFNEDIVSHRLGELYPFGKKLICPPH